MERRVVITECAAITPIGCNKNEIVDSLFHGKSGVKKIRDDGLLSEYIESGVFGTVANPPDDKFPRKYRKTMGPVSFYACQVAKEIFDRAGLKQDFISSGRLGIAFGSTHGSPTIQRQIYKTFFSQEKSKLASVGAVDYLKSMVHTTAVNIAKMFEITGRIISSCTACTTSSQSVGYGYEAVKFGIQDAMLCGGADEYDTTTVAVFDNLLACSTRYNDTPHLTPRPFDVNRDGLVVGEGAGAVLLEEYEFAKKRGANILGEVIGFACTNNGGDFILPNVDGIIQNIEEALRSSALSSDAIDVISAHATATKIGDVMEANAIGKVYGYGPAVMALKSYMGHTMASCGVIELILILYMMQDRFIAPTLNLDEIDERCRMIRHVRQPLEVQINLAAVQNFAFGGVNTCLIIKNIA